MNIVQVRDQINKVVLHYAENNLHGCTTKEVQSINIVDGEKLVICYRAE